MLLVFLLFPFEGAWKTHFSSSSSLPGWNPFLQRAAAAAAAAAYSTATDQCMYFSGETIRGGEIGSLLIPNGVE